MVVTATEEQVERLLVEVIAKTKKVMRKILYPWAIAITIIMEQLRKTITGSAEIGITNLIAIKDERVIAGSYFVN